MFVLAFNSDMLYVGVVYVQYLQSTNTITPRCKRKDQASGSSSPCWYTFTARNIHSFILPPTIQICQFVCRV